MHAQLFKIACFSSSIPADFINFHKRILLLTKKKNESKPESRKKMTQRSADEVAAYMFLYEKERKLFE